MKEETKVRTTKKKKKKKGERKKKAKTKLKWSSNSLGTDLFQVD